MTREEQTSPSGKAWENMKQRCYSEIYQKQYPTYKGCYVCDEWLNDYDAFKKWFEENYKDGFVLDKDILFEGNKLYSSETCVFVPQIINALFKQYTDKKYSVGVFLRSNHYEVKLSKFGRRCSFGSFYSRDRAELAYQNAKCDYKLELAEIWKDRIDIRVYNKLIEC